MKNLYNKIFSIISLIIIFGFLAYLPYAHFTNKKSNAESLGNNMLYQDFSGENFAHFKAAVNHFETDIKNMIMNRFPKYDGIVSTLSEIDNQMDEHIFSSRFNYLPVKSKDGIFYYDDINNMRYLRLLSSNGKIVENNSFNACKYYNHYFAEAKKANPNIELSIFAVPMTWKNISSHNALYPYNEFEIYNKCTLNLDSKINSDILNVESESVHNNFFFKTDHHWNIRGAYAGYLQICKLLNVSNPIKINEYLKLKNIKFRGSISRTLLSTKYYDSFEFIPFEKYIPENTYKTIVNGYAPTSSFSKKSFYLNNNRNSITASSNAKDYSNSEIYMKINKLHSKENIQDIYDNLYGNFYHADVGLIEYDFTEYHKQNVLYTQTTNNKSLRQIFSDNTSSSTKKQNLLLIGDSLSNCIEPLIASHFSKTYVVDQRMYGHDNPNWLSSFIKEKSISKVLILSSTNGIYCTFPENIGIRQVIK